MLISPLPFTPLPSPSILILFWVSLQDYQAIVDAEWNILYDKLERIHHSGAKVVLSKLPIGDVATQYFADRDMFCAGRVPEEDLKRTMMVTKHSQAASWLLWPWRGFNLLRVYWSALSGWPVTRPV